MNDGRAGFALRLNTALDELEIPPKQRGRFTALARLFSVSPTAARDWCEGRSYPSVDKLLLIMDTVRCDADWLLFGRSAQLLTAMHSASGTAATYTLPTGTPDARHGLAYVGTEREAHQGLDALPAELDWIAVDGDAMSPTVQAGERIGVERWRGEALTDGIYVLSLMRSGRLPAATPGNTRVLRRLLRGLDGYLEVSCDNPLYSQRGEFCEVQAGQLAEASTNAVVLSVWGRVTRRIHALS